MRKNWLKAWRSFAGANPSAAAQLQEAVIVACELLKPLAAKDQVSAYLNAEETKQLRALLDQHAQVLHIDTRDTVSCVHWTLAACLGTLMQQELRRR